MPYRKALPVTIWGDEVQTAVYSVILDVLSVQAALVFEVLLKLTVNVIVYWLPAMDEK